LLHPGFLWMHGVQRISLNSVLLQFIVTSPKEKVVDQNAQERSRRGVVRNVLVVGMVVVLLGVPRAVCAQRQTPGPIPKVLANVVLSDAQQKAVQARTVAFMTAANPTLKSGGAPRRDANGTGQRPDVAELRQQYYADLRALLTPAQQSTFDANLAGLDAERERMLAASKRHTVTTSSTRPPVSPPSDPPTQP
jgi:hypothetical protein